MEEIQPSQRSVYRHPAPSKTEPDGTTGQQQQDAGEAATADQEGETETEWKPTRRFLLAFISLQLVISAVCLEVTALPAALPIMSADLGATALQAFWAGTSYMLASTVVQPPVASMSHILGRRIVSLLSFGGRTLPRHSTILADNPTPDAFCVLTAYDAFARCCISVLLGSEAAR